MRFIYTKAFAIFSFCVLLVAVLVFMQVKGLLDPVRKGLLEIPRPVVAAVEDVVRPVKNFVVTLYQLRSITRENSSLRQKSTQLTLQLAQADQYARENAALRQELGFVKSNNLSLQPCNVLSQNPIGVSNTLILDCGSKQDIQMGDGVLSQGFLVGKIIYVSGEFSTALLLTSSQFSTDAKVSSSGVTGVVKGSFGSGFLIDELPQSTDLSAGSLVVSAGINERIPKNIVIGEVGQVVSKANDLFKKATLTSPVDLTNLDFVFVTK